MVISELSKCPEFLNSFPSAPLHIIKIRSKMSVYDEINKIVSAGPPQEVTEAYDIAEAILKNIKEGGRRYTIFRFIDAPVKHILKQKIPTLVIDEVGPELCDCSYYDMCKKCEVPVATIFSW